MSEKIKLRTSFEETPNGFPLGIAIKTVRTQQRHTGFVLIPSDSKNPKLAHFGWKNLYHYQNFENGYAFSWLDFLPQSTIVPILTKLITISKKQPISIPYGIINSGASNFDEEGAFLPDKSVQGDSLTCATFVLCILENYGFKIINRDTWHITEEDKLWQKNILADLEKYLNRHFFDMQMAAIGKFPRFRPEQVVGACCYFDFEPLDYDATQKAAQEVLNELDRLGC